MLSVNSGSTAGQKAGKQNLGEKMKGNGIVQFEEENAKGYSRQVILINSLYWRQDESQWI